MIANRPAIKSRRHASVTLYRFQRGETSRRRRLGGIRVVTWLWTIIVLVLAVGRDNLQLEGLVEAIHDKQSLPTKRDFGSLGASG